LDDLVHRLAQAVNTVNSAGLEKECAGLREHLMAAAQILPKIVLPRIAIACASDQESARDVAKRYSYSVKKAAAVFNVDELRTLFMASAPTFPDLRPELQAAYEGVRGALVESGAAASDHPKDRPGG
jgi:hypothetical protein